MKQVVFALQGMFQDGFGKVQADVIVAGHQEPRTVHQLALP